LVKIETMDGFISAALAVTMVASFLLLVSGAKRVVDRRTRPRGILMVAASFVLVTNVMIWTV
jgi:hypothetical protein